MDTREQYMCSVVFHDHIQYNMVYGSWVLWFWVFMVYGTWLMVDGLWFMVYDLWFMGHGLWFMVNG